MPAAPAATYAVAVREGSDLLTVLTIVRDIRGNVYNNIPRPHIPNHKPHASYHASGQRHAKSFDGPPMLRRNLQRPDKNFRGIENVFDLVISPDDPRALNIPCQRSDYDDVFEIPYEGLKSTKQGQLCVDLAEPGVTPPPRSRTERIICRKTFKDNVPWIIATLIDF
ncbi:MAG TPA: hypothetical protein VNZ53_20870 [Steroidobacteraceae bacterium]|jgi:hypothetical protein|nr:hypothetical protein [Steroidobacteraceae bacterium]